MGNLSGYITVGTAIVIIGYLWIVLSIWNYIKWTKKGCLPSNGISVLQKRSWMPFCCCPNIPLQPFLKMFLAILLIIIEVFFITIEDGRHKKIKVSFYRLVDTEGKLQDQSKMLYITMYSTFLFSGIMDILTMFLHLPRLTSGAFFSIAFLVEAFLFCFQLPGKDEVNIITLTILISVVLSCFTFSLLRLYSATNLFVNLGLGTSLALHGLWLVEMGHFIYGGFMKTQMNEKGHVQNTNSVLIFFAEVFVWTLISLLIFNIILWVVLSLVARQRILRKKVLKVKSATSLAIDSVEDERKELLSSSIMEQDGEVVDLQDSRV